MGKPTANIKMKERIAVFCLSPQKVTIKYLFQEKDPESISRICHRS